MYNFSLPQDPQPASPQRISTRPNCLLDLLTKIRAIDLAEPARAFFSVPPPERLWGSGEIAIASPLEVTETCQILAEERAYR